MMVLVLATGAGGLMVTNFAKTEHFLVAHFSSKIAAEETKNRSFRLLRMCRLIMNKLMVRRTL